MNRIILAVVFCASVATAHAFDAQEAREIAELRAQLQQLQQRVTLQEDTEKVRTVAFSYAYYMDNALYSEVLAMLSPNIESCELSGYGKFVGLKGCTRLWKDLVGSYYGGDKDEMAFGVMVKHYLMKDLISVSADGRTAHGRFDYLNFGGRFGDTSTVQHQIGVYNFDFVKENGVWRISKFLLSFDTPNFNTKDWTTRPGARCPHPTVKSDAPATPYHPFPEFAIVPFHDPNPVTGKPIKNFVNERRYWTGNWPGEFGGPCGVRPGADLTPPKSF